MSKRLFENFKKNKMPNKLSTFHDGTAIKITNVENRFGLPSEMDFFISKDVNETYVFRDGQWVRIVDKGDVY